MSSTELMEFDPYKKRRIDFLGVQSVSGWEVKIYTITLRPSFQSKETLNSVLKQLSVEFISRANQSKLSVHKHAFVVVHEAREGISFKAV